MFLLERELALRQILDCQGPWIVDLRTPPGPEGSNGSLLCNCRGHPGFFDFGFAPRVIHSALRIPDSTLK